MQKKMNENILGDETDQNWTLIIKISNKKLVNAEKEKNLNQWVGKRRLVGTQ